MVDLLCSTDAMFRDEEEEGKKTMLCHAVLKTYCKKQVRPADRVPQRFWVDDETDGV